MQKFQQLLGHFLCTERSTTLGCEAAPGRSWTSEKDAGWLLLVLGSHEIHVSYRLYKFHGWWELTCAALFQSGNILKQLQAVLINKLRWTSIQAVCQPVYLEFNFSSVCLVGKDQTKLYYTVMVEPNPSTKWGWTFAVAPLCNLYVLQTKLWQNVVVGRVHPSNLAFTSDIQQRSQVNQPERSQNQRQIKDIKVWFVRLWSK